MRRKLRFSKITLVVLMVIPPACVKDKGILRLPPEEPVVCGYRDHVRPFILTKCAIEACHAGSFPFGNFNNYSDLKSRIDNGKVQKLALELELMPPAGREPLSPAELQTLQCWIENEAPDN